MPDSTIPRFAYFTESLLPHVDGVSLTLARLFETLGRRGVAFRVFAPFRPDPSVPWRGRVRTLPYVRFPLYRDYRISLPARGLSRELRAFGPDLVHVVSPTPTAVWAQRWAARRGVPLVASFHTHFVSYFPYYRVRPLQGLGWRYLRWFHDRCATTYAPSAGMAAELRRRGIARVDEWSRGVDLERFSPARRDPAIREAAGAADRPLLLFAGRLVREKDLAELVEACRILEGRGHRFRLALVGEGPMRRELQAALPGACFAGHQEGEALARWFASADVFVFPSTTETFGNVVQEAAASGVPAVVAAAGGPADLVADGVTGLIARPHDPHDFAARVERLLADPDFRRTLGAGARAGVAGRDWDAVNDRYLDRCRAIVAAARRREPAPR